jgi:hypothetical protein
MGKRCGVYGPASDRCTLPLHSINLCIQLSLLVLAERRHCWCCRNTGLELKHARAHGDYSDYPLEQPTFCFESRTNRVPHLA